MAIQNTNITRDFPTEKRKRQEDREKNLKAFRDAGDQAFARSDYEEALVNYLNAQQIAVSFENSTVLSIIQASIANTYVKLGKYEQAESFYKEATDLLSKDSLGSKKQPNLTKASIYTIIYLILLTILWIVFVFRKLISFYTNLNILLIIEIEINNLLLIIFVYIFYFFIRKWWEKQRKKRDGVK
jgi:tetratricopeptide (TPR) repeat protein